MLADFALRNLKPRAILYKVADRDGMYVIVSPKGTITFRYDYRINGRRETLTIGRYGFGGISLAEAREKLRRARRLLGEGTSPALQKQREKGRGPETLNRVTQLVVERAKVAGLPPEPFTVHDLRHTGSTLLHEPGFNRDWTEKWLAHEDGRSLRSIYNKAEYAEQRRHMLQEWAGMVDAWINE